jgi:hypothetical protein
VPAPAPGRSPNNINPVDPQSANRPLVTITEDAQQPSITKPAQQPSRPTSNCVRRLSHRGPFCVGAAARDPGAVKTPEYSSPPISATRLVSSHPDHEPKDG